MSGSMSCIERGLSKQRELVERAMTSYELSAAECECECEYDLS